MNSKSENWKYRFLIGIMTASNCFASSYGTYYLLNNGISDFQAGIIIAIANILSTVVAPALGRVADKSKKWSAKTLLAALSLFECLLALTLICIPNVFVVAIVYCLLVSNVYIITPLANALTFQYKRHKIQIDFGVARGFGSLIYAVVTFFLGKCTDLWGTISIPIACIFVYVFVFVMALKVLPAEPIFTNNVVKTVKTSRKGFIKKYPIFFLMIVGIMLVLIFHNMVMVYFIHIVEEVGCGATEMGYAVALGAFVEIPMLFLYTKLNKRIKTATLLFVAMFSFFVKGIILCFAFNILMVYLAQLFAFSSFGLMAAARVYYAHEMVDPEDEVTGQSLMNTTDTIALLCASFIGGVLMSYFGQIQVLLIVGTTISLIGVIIVATCAIKGRK